MEGEICIIPCEVKKRCVALAAEGKSYRELYEEYGKKYTNMSYKTFCRKMADWKHKYQADEQMLENANIAFRFTPHASTVQLNAKGQLVQAWIKQNTNDYWEEILQAIKDNTPVYNIEPKQTDDAEGMLEIPLFDMHFGIADLEYYMSTLQEILALICSKRWDMIVIPVGQDLFHNDSIANGTTTKGTQIEKVDLQKAFYDAKVFYFNIIEAAIEKANSVKVIYSPGNHDRTAGWMFTQTLLERYGSRIVDDSIKDRKAILWEQCFIGITHGDKKTDTAHGLRSWFTFEYPCLFAVAKVREIHTGHLHNESTRDEYGVLVRRMSAGNKDDEWTIREGYKAKKRFMLFEYMPGKLKSIHYVGGE